MPLQHTNNVHYEMLPSDVACAMEVLRSEKQEFGSHHGMIAEDIEFQNQCPAREEDVPGTPGLCLPEDKSLSSATCSISTTASSDRNCTKVELRRAKSQICFLEFSMT